MGVYKGLRYMYIKIHWIFDDKYFNFYSSYYYYETQRNTRWPFSATKEPELTWPGATTAQNTNRRREECQPNLEKPRNQASIQPNVRGLTPRGPDPKRPETRIPAILDDLVEASTKRLRINPHIHLDVPQEAMGQGFQRYGTIWWRRHRRRHQYLHRRRR